MSFKSTVKPNSIYLKLIALLLSLPDQALKKMDKTY